MPQTLTEIRALLAAAGASPNRDLGQNFLIDHNLLALVADAGEITPDDVLLEIGPGTGTLTETLLARLGAFARAGSVSAEARCPGRLVAVELDRALHQLLVDRLGENPQVTLIHADALAELPAVLDALRDAGVSAVRPAKLIANLPYSVASPLVAELIASSTPFERLVFLVQREVGERMLATTGDDYGPLSVVVQAFSDSVELLRRLPKQAFWPAPKIESVLMRIRPLAPSARAAKLGPAWALLPIVVRHLFGYRRKTLSRVLSLLPDRNDLPTPAWPTHLHAAVTAAGITLDRRAESLSVADIVRVVRGLNGEGCDHNSLNAR